MCSRLQDVDSKMNPFPEDTQQAEAVQGMFCAPNLCCTLPCALGTAVDKRDPSCHGTSSLMGGIINE